MYSNRSEIHFIKQEFTVCVSDSYFLPMEYKFDSKAWELRKPVWRQYSGTVWSAVTQCHLLLELSSDLKKAVELMQGLHRMFVKFMVKIKLLKRDINLANAKRRFCQLQFGQWGHGLFILWCQMP